MTDDIELIEGTGNPFADLGFPGADILQMKVRVAVEIARTLDDRGLSVRRASDLTGHAAADFSRVRRMALSRFTLDRLVAMLTALDRRVLVSISFSPRDATGAAELPAVA